MRKKIYSRPEIKTSRVFDQTVLACGKTSPKVGKCKFFPGVT